MAVVVPATGNITHPPIEKVDGLTILPVITELHGLVKDAGSVGALARSALIAIRKDISGR